MSSVYDALVKAGKRNETISGLSLSWQGISLESKIMVFVVGLLFVVIVNQLMGRALRTQMGENAVVTATTLSDAAAGYIASKDILALKTIVTKYARLNRVAYVYIKDRDGKLIAHSSATFSPELQEELTADQRHEVSWRELTLQGKTVYETREPILEGQLGTAHIGILADAVERDIDQVLFMFLWPITLGLLLAVIVVVILARPLIRALRRWIDSRLESEQATSTHPLE